MKKVMSYVCDFIIETVLLLLVGDIIGAFVVYLMFTYKLTAFAVAYTFNLVRDNREELFFFIRYLMYLLFIRMGNCFINNGMKFA